MSDKFIYDDEQLDNAYKTGIAVGWEQAASWLFGEATKAFQLRNDNMATILRKYADIAKERSDKEHPKSSIPQGREGV